MQTRMKFRYKAYQFIVQCLRRISFITSAVKTDRRMITYFSEIIFCVCNKHLFIERIRSVIRVGKPEVLPYHHSVSVAGFIEFLVTCHSDPVTDHGEIHICMISYSNVIFTSTVVDIDFRESPVTSVGYEPSSIDEDIQDIIIHSIGHLTHSALDLLYI